MATKRPVQREHLNDRQWSDFCRLMDLTAELKGRVRERRARREERDRS